MTFRLAILSLLFALFAAAPTNGVLACGAGTAGHEAQSHGREQSEAACCAQQPGAADHCAGQTSDDCGQMHPGQPCSEGADGHCHCPGCGTVAGGCATAALSEAPAALVSGGASVARQAFYFAEHLPEAVYLPIWQPPKLRAQGL